MKEFFKKDNDKLFIKSKDKEEFKKAVRIIKENRWRQIEPTLWQRLKYLFS